MTYTSLKEQVCATAKEIFTSRLVTGTWGNVSARVGDSREMVITPSGMDYNTLQADDMIVVGPEGQVIQGRFKPSIETPMHLAIYNNRPDVKAIVHVHSPYATSFAVANQPIPVILEETAQVIGHEVLVAAYAHCGSAELAQEVVRMLGRDRKAVLLANHGLVGVDNTLSGALRVCYVAEKTAMITISARQLGSINPLPSEDINYLKQGFKYYGQQK